LAARVALRGDAAMWKENPRACDVEREILVQAGGERILVQAGTLGMCTHAARGVLLLVASAGTARAALRNLTTASDVSRGAGERVCAG